MVYPLSNLSRTMGNGAMTGCNPRALGVLRTPGYESTAYTGSHTGFLHSGHEASLATHLEWPKNSFRNY